MPEGQLGLVTAVMKEEDWPETDPVKGLGADLEMEGKPCAIPAFKTGPKIFDKSKALTRKMEPALLPVEMGVIILIMDSGFHTEIDGYHKNCKKKRQQDGWGLA